MNQMLHVLKKKVSLLWGTFLQLIWDPYHHDKLIHYLFEYSKCKSCHFQKHTYPAGNYRLKVNNRNTRTRREIYSKLTIKSPERQYWRRFGVFIVNFEYISHLVLVFLLLTWASKYPVKHLKSSIMDVWQGF